MRAERIPPWCDWNVGGSQFLVVAPHGGHRRAGTSRNRSQVSVKVNDLHTADVGALLAERLDASLISNLRHDRNDLDLNRISQVLDGAPWFLDLLESLLATILAQHEVAEILVVHGWNVTQKRCDVGIGSSLQDESQGGSAAHLLTVSPDYLAGRLREFQQCAAAAGIHVTYGERYAAKHPNNLLQLFRRSPHERTTSVRPRLAGWAASERVQAVQLELGAPLRWPGAWRERLLDRTAQAFSTPPSLVPPRSRPGQSVPSQPQSSRASPRNLQFYDPLQELGVMGRVDPNPAGTYASSRILILRGPLTAALFTGEERTRAAPLGGPSFNASPGGFRLGFDGPLLQLPDARLYVELEQALAASHLVDASVEVSFEDCAISSYGRVHGTICVDGGRFAIDTFGFTRVALPDSPQPESTSRTSLTASFGDRHMLRVRSDGNGSALAVRATTDGESTLPTAALAVDFAPDRRTPHRFSLAIEDHPPVVALPASQMVICRPNGKGGASLITFGVARFTWQGHGEGSGFYEHAQTLAPSP